MISPGKRETNGKCDEEIEKVASMNERCKETKKERKKKTTKNNNKTMIGKPAQKTVV